MSEPESLFQELQPAIEQLAGPLLSASQGFVKKRGAFLPHGAVLSASGEIRLVMAAPPEFETERVSTLEVLPLLHQALRQEATQDSVSAVAVCEDVRITLEGEKQTPAIKVLIEHRRGLCIALYMPYRRRLFRCSFGEVIVNSANMEINAWASR